MRIVVLVKQVPADGSVRMEDGRLMRDAVPAVLNPMCEYALDLAVRMGKGAETVAVSMGPPQARSALMRCLELGADRAVLVSGREFAGSDVFATATALTACIRWIGDVDIIITGQRASDGDTGQVPAEVATMLDIPSIGHCTGAIRDDDSIVLTTERDGIRSIVSSRMPMLLSVSWGSNVRRMPSMADHVRASSIGVVTVTADDIGLDPGECGSRGSRTSVMSTFSPPRRRSTEPIRDLERAIDSLVETLKGGMT